MRDDQGEFTQIMVDSNGEIMVLGLPLDTEVFIEESTVPEGYFPNAAQVVTLTANNTYEMPLETTITNTPSVKLGIDSDKYNVLIAIGVCMLGMGIVVWRVIAAKKAAKKHKEE